MITVFRIYDPVAQEFLSRSGRGLYAKNGKSIWMSRRTAMIAVRKLPPVIRARAEIKVYSLVEVKPGEANYE
jgi:hypothetical protein